MVLLAVVGAAVPPAEAQVSPGPLSGAHADLEGNRNCMKCHGSRKSSQDEHCLECHSEIAWLLGQNRGFHAGAGREDCVHCHPEHGGRDFDLIEFETGRPEGFDHDRAGWQLEGKHGSLKCRDCHKPELQVGAVAKIMKRKQPQESWLGLERECLQCHADTHRGTLGNDCRSCHTLTAWKPAGRFDHAKSKFPLTGKHEKIDCNKCHLAAGLETWVDDGGLRVPLYKPVPHGECGACHKDVHAGRLGRKCSVCHVATGFLQVDRNRFDHSVARFPLRGRHATVECSKCHDPQNAGGKRPAFDRCGVCHADSHAGLATIAGRSVDCEACHNEQGFTPSVFTVAQHAKTGYPLNGRHEQVKCGSCHVRKPRGVPAETLGRAAVLMRPRFDRCGSCHADLHGGQLAKRSHRGECGACHRVEGWKPSTYPVSQHARLRLPLEGGHLGAACGACHGPERKGLPPLPGEAELGRARVALTRIGIRCDSCHFDPHDGRFDPKKDAAARQSCPVCHDAEGFRPARVDTDFHQRFDFRLDGAHRAVPCSGCHQELKKVPPKTTLVAAPTRRRNLIFSEKKAGCDGCHATPHGIQFEARPGGSACDTCHGTDTFQGGDRFSHNKHSVFALDGSHRPLACGKCHPSRKLRDGKRQVLYRPIRHRCQDCHKARIPEPTAVSPRPASGSPPAAGGSK